MNASLLYHRSTTGGVLTVEVPDINENRLKLLMLIKELRICGNSLDPKEFKSGSRAPAEGTNDERVNGRGTAGFRRAFCGKMMVESILCLENSLVNLRKTELFSM